MRSSLKYIALALAASLALAACGSSSSNSGSSSQAATTPAAPTPKAGGEGAATVKSASNATLGETVLVDAQGMTLYSLSAEQGGKFICTGSCLQTWHPLVASGGTPSGAVGSLGTIKRPEGSEQVTYKGMPVYTFAQDQGPGEANGQGIKDVGTWSAVSVAPATATSSTATAPASSSPGY